MPQTLGILNPRDKRRPCKTRTILRSLRSSLSLAQALTKRIAGRLESRSVRETRKPDFPETDDVLGGRGTQQAHHVAVRDGHEEG